MITISLEQFVAAGVPLVVGIAWLIRQEGRINTLAVQMREMRDDVVYIRNRIDRAIETGRR